MGLTERRIGLLFAIFLGLLAIAGGRTLWLGGVKASALQRAADTQQVNEIHVPARRGAITDRNGIELAVSEPASDVSATPYLVKSPLRAAKQLGPLLGQTQADVLDKLDTKSGFVYLARNLPAPKVDAIKKLDIPGLTFDPSSRRDYPRRWLASQVIGGVGVDRNGLSGLEYAQDKILHGTDGTRRIVKDGAGDPIVVQETKPAVAGKDLRLTLDAQLQGKVEDVLAQVGEKWRPKGATALVMDPRSSTVLALANWPRVDANDLGGAPAYAAQDRAVGFNYEPGSTFKAFTVAGALKDGVVDAGRLLPPAADDPGRRPHDQGGGGARDRRPHDLADPRAVLERRHRAHRPAPRRDALRSLGAQVRLRQADRHRAGRRGVRPGHQAQHVLRLVDGQPADRPGRVGHAAAARDGVLRDRRRRRPAPAAARSRASPASRPRPRSAGA